MAIKSLNKLAKEELQLVSGGVKKQFVVHFSANLAKQNRELAILSLIEGINSGFDFIGVKSFSKENLIKLAEFILNSKSKTYEYFYSDNKEGPDFYLDIYVDF